MSSVWKTLCLHAHGDNAQSELCAPAMHERHEKRETRYERALATHTRARTHTHKNTNKQTHTHTHTHAQTDTHIVDDVCELLSGLIDAAHALEVVDIVLHLSALQLQVPPPHADGRLWDVVLPNKLEIQRPDPVVLRDRQCLSRSCTRRRGGLGKRVPSCIQYAW